MTNIFCLSQLTNNEDRFTASLHYVLEFHPDLGQSIVDFLVKSSSLPKATFIKSIDHPYHTYEDKPDFLIECDQFDIICEHKLDAPLGYEQLERYLKLKRERNFYLVLITATACEVSESIISSSRYLKPTDSSRPYFRWQDFYHIFENYNSRLTQDFTEYMKMLGMQPWTSDVLGDLFESEEAAKWFSKGWEEVRQYFKLRGAQCKRSGDLSFQVRQPKTLKDLRLLYLYVQENVSCQRRECDNPYLAANIWIEQSTYDRYKFAFQGNYKIPIGQQLIYSQQEYKIAGWDKNLVQGLTFYTSLEPLLSDDINIVRKNILSFTIAIFNLVARVLGQDSTEGNTPG